MKKIGIVTLHGYDNYGNKLQNFALLYVLKKMGYEASTTIVKNKKTSNYLNSINHYLKLGPKSLLSRIKKRSSESERKLTKEEDTSHNNRLKKFKNFSINYLNEKFYSLDIKIDLQDLEQYSFFVTGSDQVWNPSIYRLLDIYFLTFTSKKKRIAYAPSISRDRLPKRYKKSYKKWLNGMAAISVREKAGSKIIKNLTGREAPVLVDPTMLLKKDEWLSISKRANNRPDKPYILTYFLGGPTDETREKLEKLALEEDMDVINLGDITETHTYETGPNEFLDYINNASAFFTDSFHGVVFSIIFQTPFIVYKRISSEPSMYSRIETILDNFNMRNREAKGFNEDIFSMDFSGTHEVLDREYTKSINYLKEALRIEE